MLLDRQRPGVGQVEEVAAALEDVVGDVEEGGPGLNPPSLRLVQDGEVQNQVTDCHQQQSRQQPQRSSPFPP